MAQYINNPESDVDRIWSIHFCLPKDESKGRRYSMNKHANLSAKTLIQAVSLIMSTYPDAAVWSAGHIGILGVKE